ncbi:hypothetical protein PT974_01854 [Cladobotryum mycophilum]|uniref:F-box domain-containing protein n=1 Tax=Cladobotryum mycophilum TaxID=491253 RepID=A0ABR0SWR0_9HYPO
MQLEDLAPELLTLILRTVDSPRSLYRLISASPACWQVFSSSPEFILSSVVKNVISYDLLNLYLAVIHVPAFTGDLELFRQQVPIFLDAYFDSKLFAFPTTKADLVGLCRLNTHVSYLSVQYFQSAIYALGYEKHMYALERESPTTMIHFSSSERTESMHDLLRLDSYFREFPQNGIPEYEDRLIYAMHAEKRECAVPPSHSERVRFLRAFLRFELYSRVFPSGWKRQHNCLSTHDAAEQSHLFVKRMEPWEIEEMSCVHHYYSSVAGRLLDELEEELVRAVQTAPGVTFTSPQLDLDQMLGISDNRLTFFNRLDLIGLDVYSRTGRWDSSTYIGYIVSLGIDFMHKLAVGDKVRRSALIRSTLSKFGRPFLPEALEELPARQPIVRPLGNNWNNDPSLPNAAYYRCRNTITNSYLKILDNPSGLREMAYMFWDCNRSEKQPVYGKLDDAGWLSNEKRKKLFDRSERQSAEERLQG